MPDQLDWNAAVSPASHSGPEAAPSATAVRKAGIAINVVERRGVGGLGLFLQVADEQRLYRMAPVRDPRQPRFWCLAAFECSSCGIPVTGAAIWAGAWGSSRQELAGMLDTIRADAIAWLAAEERANLRALLLRPREPLPLERGAQRDGPHGGFVAEAGQVDRAS